MAISVKVDVLCDFDGTITNEDIGFKIIEAFAGPGWEEVEAAYQRGEKGSREALLEIFAMTSVSAETLTSFIENHFYVDPAFPDFINLCRKSGMAVTILSDGFDFYIDLIFRKFKLNLPYLSNSLRVVDSSLRAEFPYSSKHCGSCGNCKMDYAKKVKASGSQIVYIGDGFSDKCVSSLADVLFAKGVLAEHCRKEGTSYFPFEGFNDISSVFKGGLFSNLINGRITE